MGTALKANAIVGLVGAVLVVARNAANRMIDVLDSIRNPVKDE